jgi:hypothetical protein
LLGLRGFGVGTEKLSLGARGEWLCWDGVQIIVIYNHNVFAAVAGGDEKRMVQLLCIWLVMLIGENVPATRAGPHTQLANMHQSQLNFMQVQATSCARVATLTNYKSNLASMVRALEPR